MTTRQPEALRLAEMLTANEWPGHVTLVSYAQECVAELLRQHAENETVRAGYAAARPEIESLKAQLHAAKQINAAQFGLLAASIPGSALRASRGQAPAQPATVHCKGRNCAAVDGYGHSDECASDHERAASGLDTAGNRNPVARYDGYRGAPCNPAYTKDQQAAWLEGCEARNRQGITPSPQADNKKKDTQ